MKFNLNKYQKALWKHAGLYEDNFYNLGLSFKLLNHLQVDLLEQSFHFAVNSVDILHSILVEKDSDYYFDTINGASFDFNIENVASPDVCEEQMNKFTNEPVDLHTQWPIRVRLYRLPDNSYLLAIVFHHICIDGVSVVDFLNILADVYNELLVKQSYPQLNIPTSQQLVISPDKEKYESVEFAKSYWKDILDNTQQNIKFKHFEKTLTSSNRFQYMKFDLGVDLMQQLQHVSRQMGTTPFLIIMSAWMFLLHRFSGQSDILVDTAINVRTSHSQNLIGFFVNNLPMRLSFNKNTNCRNLILSLTQQRKCLKKVQSYLLTDIVRMLQDDKQVAVKGGTNVGMNFVGWSDALQIPLNKVDVHFYKRLDTSSNLDLLLEVDPTQYGHSRICYLPFFQEDFISSLIEGLKQTLYIFVTNPERMLADISVISAQKQEKLEVDNILNLERIQPVSNSINELFDEIVKKYSHIPALVYKDTRITYRLLHEQSERIAKIIRKRYYLHNLSDLPVGSPIGIYTSNRLQAIQWIMSILKAGGTYVYLSYEYPLDRIDFIINDYGIQTILTDVPEKFTSSVLCIIGDKEDDVIENEELPQVPCNTNAYIISTSGTTGTPKGVPITHQQTIRLIRSGFYVEKENSILLQYANLTFDASVLEIFNAFLTGSTLIIPTEEERLSPSLLIQLLQKESIEAAILPPVLLTEFPACELPKLKILVVAGETTPDATIQRWRKGRKLINGYGPTECTVCATACVMDETTHPNDIGLPIKGISCYVLDSHMNLQPDYVPGELYIGGPQITSGYINRPQLSADKIITNPFTREDDNVAGYNAYLYKTGDWVYRLPNGHFIFIGRIDSQVKLHGFRIELEEIENKLNQYPGVGKSLVSLENIGNDKKLVAYIQSNENLQFPEIQTYLKTVLPYYMIPGLGVILQSFPLTANGKIDKSRLSLPSQGDVSLNVMDADTFEEKQLIRIVSTILQTNGIGVDVDLFDFGLTSIQVIMAVYTSNSLGLNISVSTFYKERTIRKILANKKSSMIFEANEQRKDKPVLLVICGDIYFTPGYSDFVKTFGEYFSLVVIESYHEYFRDKDNCDCKELVKLYVQMLVDFLDVKDIYAVAGFCVGGEIALQLAVELSKLKSVAPKLFLLDSFVNRDTTNVLMQDYPGATEQISNNLNRVTTDIIKSMHHLPYKGETHIYLATRFSTDRFIKKEDKGVQEKAYMQFSENELAWKTLMPDCNIHFVDTDHWHILDKDALSQIMQTVILT